ncbi:MAG TPA: hypothetical protein VFK05_25745 [Polyangiaceae bacterium]|nr:hypothetical protein [Polyangiaceae bacterium]
MSLNGWKRGLGGAIALAFALAACQDGYPIAPTRCDRWCKITRASECGFSSPADCVATCESTSGFGACNEALDALLACLQAHETSIRCETWANGTIAECVAEQTRLVACAAHTAPGPRSDR